MKGSGFRWDFVLRGVMLSALFLGMAGVAGFLWLRWLSGPPVLVDLLGAQTLALNHPDKTKGLHFQSSGFFLQVGEGIYASTAAHSLIDFWGRGMPKMIPVTLPGDSSPVFQIKTAGGAWGRPRWGRDLRVDYALFVVNQAVDPAWVLQPDARGQAEPGERVWLHSGAGDGAEVFGGVVYNVSARAVWVVMDEKFSPWGMSGSPFISAETAHVVGMAIVTGQQDGRLVIGMHPIGSLVKKIKAAFP